MPRQAISHLLSLLFSPLGNVLACHLALIMHSFPSLPFQGTEPRQRRLLLRVRRLHRAAPLVAAAAGAHRPDAEPPAQDHLGAAGGAARNRSNAHRLAHPQLPAGERHHRGAQGVRSHGRQRQPQHTLGEALGAFGKNQQKKRRIDVEIEVRANTNTSSKYLLPSFLLLPFSSTSSSSTNTNYSASISPGRQDKTLDSTP